MAVPTDPWHAFSMRRLSRKVLPEPSWKHGASLVELDTKNHIQPASLPTTASCFPRATPSTPSPWHRFSFPSMVWLISPQQIAVVWQHISGFCPKTRTCLLTVPANAVETASRQQLFFHQDYSSIKSPSSFRSRLWSLWPWSHCPSCSNPYVLFPHVIWFD